jgi:hypothetical protein
VLTAPMLSSASGGMGKPALQRRLGRRLLLARCGKRWRLCCSTAGAPTAAEVAAAPPFTTLQIVACGIIRRAAKPKQQAEVEAGLRGTASAHPQLQ